MGEFSGEAKNTRHKQIQKASSVSQQLRLYLVSHWERVMVINSGISERL